MTSQRVSTGDPPLVFCDARVQRVLDSGIILCFADKYEPCRGGG